MDLRKNKPMEYDLLQCGDKSPDLFLLGVLIIFAIVRFDEDICEM